VLDGIADVVVTVVVAVVAEVVLVVVFGVVEAVLVVPGDNTDMVMIGSVLEIMLVVTSEVIV
jgi:hypothetical protein